MATRIRVMTFNIRHGRGLDDRLDLRRTAEVIKACGPDVVGLQEVDRHFDARSDFMDQSWWLGRELGMTALYGAGLVQDPLTPGRPLREYGDAILSAADVVTWAAVPLPAAPENEGRVLIQATLDAGGQEIRVWSTHLSHESEPQRVEQAGAIGELIGSGQAPHVLVGDLNATPDSLTIGRLTQDLGDAWQAAGDGGPGYTFDAEQPSIRIDYVLTGPGVRVAGIEVVEVGGATDHRAIVADLDVT